MTMENNPSGQWPLRNWIIVKPEPVETETVTSGGIIIDHAEKTRVRDPRTGKVLNKLDEEDQYGELIAMGPWAFRDEDNNLTPDAPQIGGRVFYAKYSGIVFEHPVGEKYRTMKDTDTVNGVFPKK